MSLPAFKYHPDPIGTGSIEAGEVDCVCCGEVREYTYVGPVYASTDFEVTGDEAVILRILLTAAPRFR